MLDGRWFTNSIQISGDQYGAFEYASKVNHSGSPNTTWRWDEHTGQFEGLALRGIKRVEEITRDYYA